MAFVRTNLITNPQFLTSLTGWTATNVAWLEELGHQTAGKAEFAPLPAGNASLYQQITTATSGDGGYRARFMFSLRIRGTAGTTAVPDNPFVATIQDVAVDFQWSVSIDGSDMDVERWYRFAHDILVQDATLLDLTFSVAMVTDTDRWQLDDVVFDVAIPLDLSCGDLVLELQKRRHDMAAQKHNIERYRSVVNESIRQAPRSLWRTDLNISLNTAVDTAGYSLSTITNLTRAKDLRQVFLYDDDDETYYEVQRWRLEADGTDLNLYFEEIPTEVKNIKLAYLIPYAELDCADPTSVTALDRDWLVAKAMTLLLLEADPQLEDPTYLAAQLQYWDAQRQAKEREAAYHRPARLAKTHKWTG